MNKLILIIIPFLLSFSAGAQQTTPTNAEMEISARSYLDHIQLRFAPTTPILMSQANRTGYILERADFVQGIPFSGLNYAPVKGSPFKRWDEAHWRQALTDANQKDTTLSKLIVLAMTYSDSAMENGDLLKSGLNSLKEQKNNADMRFGFSLIAANRSQTAATGLALGTSDSEVIPGKSYVYRVHINKPVTASANAMAYVKITCENFNEKYLRNDKAVSVDEGDKRITFSFPESTEYYAFIAERSDDEGISYKRIIQTPILNLNPAGFEGSSDFAYRDTTVTNYKKYRYRVMVSTIFGDDLLLSEFTAMPRDKTPPPAPFLQSATHIKPGQVELRWSMSSAPVPDLKGFVVKRGTQENGTYLTISKNILSGITRSYLDDEFDKEGPNYYIVEALDTAGNSSRSFPAYVTLIDTIPPAIPEISSAKIDSTGKITIKIKPNLEKDFMGYQLLKANSREHEFSVILETYKDTLGRHTFILNDSTTLNTLTKRIFYKVIAFDTHFNQSDPSKIVELTKRDTIPPVSPLITGYSVKDSSVILTFANSSSEDAIQNILLRREAGKAKFDTIFSNSNILVITYTDKKFTGGLQYEYAMVAKDDGGLYSKVSKGILIRTLRNNRIPTPLLQGSYDAKSKKINLTFQADEKLNHKTLQVEIFKRSDTKSMWVSFNVVNYEKGKPFQDEPSPGQTEMIYAIRLTDENHNTSNLSKELVIKF